MERNITRNKLLIFFLFIFFYAFLCVCVQVSVPGGGDEAVPQNHAAGPQQDARGGDKGGRRQSGSTQEV